MERERERKRRRERERERENRAAALPCAWPRSCAATAADGGDRWRR